MSSNWGTQIKISIFGESHGDAIGVVIDGLPGGIEVSGEEISSFMRRRAPGKNAHSTKRSEADAVMIQSGFLKGKTTGAPICAIIENTDRKSSDYEQMQSLARPGHADFTAHMRYGGHNDVRGGGHFSGRLTAPLCFAGAVAIIALKQRGIYIGAHISKIHNAEDNPYSADSLLIKKEDLTSLSQKDFAVFDDNSGEKMRNQIKNASENLDSVGGIIECIVLNMPTGIGSPIFDGLENKIASAIFAIPAVKGLEFGCGFELASMYGSESNDEFIEKNGVVQTKTNNQGGILGGISIGTPITLKVAFKPTPTIAKKQDTINYKTLENAKIESKGRHDPCVVPRAVPCVEAAVALAILDSILILRGIQG